MKPHHLAELNQENRIQRLTILNAARKYPGKYHKDIYREHLEVVRELRLTNNKLNGIKPTVKRKQRSYAVYIILLIVILIIWIFTKN